MTISGRLVSDCGHAPGGSFARLDWDGPGAVGRIPRRSPDSPAWGSNPSACIKGPRGSAAKTRDTRAYPVPERRDLIASWRGSGLGHEENPRLQG